MLQGGEVELGLGEGLARGQEGDLGAAAGASALAAPTASGASGTPSRKRMKCSVPSRQMRRSSRSESALTTETPTPCSPPETL